MDRFLQKFHHRDHREKNEENLGEYTLFKINKLLYAHFFL